MPGALLIRRMEEADLAFAAECTQGEGWVSENRETLEGFFIRDGEGCFMAEESRQPVGIVVALYYGQSGFIGELIVRKDARGRGIGADLLNHAVRYLHRRGVKTVYLDGVVNAVPMYERNGFRKVCRSWRFSGRLEGINYPGVRQMQGSDLEQVYTLDLSAFGVNRSFYLHRRWELFPELCHVMEQTGRVTGYIEGKGGEGWTAAGPWVVDASVAQPVALLHALATGAAGRLISVGILETNMEACRLAQALGFEVRPDSPWRMALGDAIDLGASSGCYAVGSAGTG